MDVKPGNHSREDTHQCGPMRKRTIPHTPKQMERTADVFCSEENGEKIKKTAIKFSNRVFWNGRTFVDDVEQFFLPLEILPGVLKWDIAI